MNSAAVLETSYMYFRFLMLFHGSHYIYLKRLTPHYPCNLAPRFFLVSKHYNLCVRFPALFYERDVHDGNNGELTALSTNSILQTFWDTCSLDNVRNMALSLKILAINKG